MRQRQYDYAYVFGAVCPARDEAFALVLPGVKTAAMALHLQADEGVPAGRHALVVVDGACWQSPSVTQGLKNLTLLKLPPASPELNPTEQVW